MHFLDSRSFCCAFLLGISSVYALDPFAFDGVIEGKKSDESTWHFISEAKSVAPGQKFSVALALSHPDGWHSYYVNSGGIEDCPRIDWSLPKGFQAGEIQWPAPHVNDPAFQIDEANPVKSYQYAKDDAFLVIDLTVPADAKPGTTVEIKGKANWQICKDSCKDENAALHLTLPVAEKLELDPARAKAFADARARQGSKADFTFRFERDAGKLQMVIRGAGDLTDAHFISQHPMVLASLHQKAEKTEDAWRINLTTQKENVAGIEIEPTDRLGGFLVFTEGGVKKSVVVPETMITKAPAPPLAWSKFLPVLFGMFFGGLILNLMPCVFPVIGIKILGFVQQAGQDRKKIVLHGLVFALGVIVSFWALSGFLFAARAAGGDNFGWGYQLQDKWLVLGLMMLMFVMALNLYGLFEIGTSATGIGGNLQSKQGMVGTFFSGVLATVVATPCSGPFLGVAIGVAIGLPAVQFFTAFTVMALGLALPYLLMSAFPKLVDCLPRPGAWMETFKQGMSFLMFGTAGYLLWVYGGLIEYDNLLHPIIGMTLVALGCWIYGRWNGYDKTKRTRIVASVFALLAVTCGVYYAGSIKQGLEWEAWSQQRVEELQDEETPVFVDFTAKWCLTCQVNKKNAYNDEVIALFKEYGIVALKADKTKPTPEIERALDELGRTAIPVNVLYVPGKEPIITPEVLTPAYMKELIEKNVEKP